MNRRVFLVVAGALTISRALAQRGPAMLRVALGDTALATATMVEGSSSPWGILLGELRTLGYVEGKNVVIERWSAAGAASSTAYRDLARKVVSSNPAAIVVRSRSMLVFF